MHIYLPAVGGYPRQSAWPFRVERFFVDTHFALMDARPQPMSMTVFELCFRLASNVKECTELINGKEVVLGFPHVVLKHPGYCWTGATDDSWRDVLSFCYPVECFSQLEQLGMLPPECGAHFSLTAEINNLVAQLRQMPYHLQEPGGVEELDWLCFRLLRETLLSRCQSVTTDTRENAFERIAAWMTIHCCAAVDLNALANRYGMSRSVFFQEWRKYYSQSPKQFILEQRLQAAQRLLKETDMSIARIVEETHFSGAYAFHRRFCETYGCTPGEWRKRQKRLPTDLG